MRDITNLPCSNLNELFATLEDFVCKVYGAKGITDVNIARVATFSKAYGNDGKNVGVLNLKNKIDGSMFPPCKSELVQHCLRTAYIAHLWSHAHLPTPTELSPTDYGWEENDNLYIFKWFEGDQLPPSITNISTLDINAEGMTNKNVRLYLFLN